MARQQALARLYEDWCGLILDHISQAHSDIAQHVIILMCGGYAAVDIFSCPRAIRAVNPAASGSAPSTNAPVPRAVGAASLPEVAGWLLRPQHDHRIGPGGTKRRDEAGRTGDAEQQRGVAGEDKGIVGGDPE